MIGNKALWLACETDEFNSIDPNLLQRASQAEYTSGEEGLVKFIQTSMKDCGLIFYYAKFGNKLRRLN